MKYFCEVFAKSRDQEILCVNITFLAVRIFRDLSVLSQIDEEHVRSDL